MSWSGLFLLLPKIATSIPAIVAYVVLTIAFTFYLFRRQKAADWKRLLESADKNADAASKLARETGFEHGFGGNLSEDRRLRLRLRQLTAGIVLCIIVAATLVGLAVVQTVSQVSTKDALLRQMKNLATQLQDRINVDQANRGLLIGELGRLEARTELRAEDRFPDSAMAEVAKELAVLRSRFTETIDRRYLTQRDLDHLQIIDATISLSANDSQSANSRLPDELLNRISDYAAIEQQVAIRANIVAIAARIDLNDFQGVISCADRILKLQPRHWFALQQRAHALLRMGKYEDAIRDLADVEPDDIPANVSWLYPTMVSGKFPSNPETVEREIRASEVVNKSLAASPFGFSVRYLSLLGRKESPAACKFSTVSERKQFMRIWLGIEMRINDNERAAYEIFKNAVVACGDDPEALQNFAISAMALKDYPTAESTFQRLAEKSLLRHSVS